jgi:hypothetical protein
VVRSRGLEPPRVAPLAPQASASTSSATTASGGTPSRKNGQGRRATRTMYQIGGARTRAARPGDHKGSDHRRHDACNNNETPIFAAGRLQISGDVTVALQSLTYSLDIDRRQCEPARRAGRSASDFGREQQKEELELRFSAKEAHCGGGIPTYRRAQSIWAGALNAACGFITHLP